MKLKKSPVTFNQEAHTYHLEGVQLQGVTGMINDLVFPDKYTDIPHEILRKAAERGTYIHQCCELVDALDIVPDNLEARNYIALRLAHGLEVEESEYLVSDEKHFATCIDKVFRSGETTFHLADIKTTHKLDTEYVRWQLSVNAHLFELQNPEAKVDALFAIWLRGETAQLVDVERLPQETVLALMESRVAGTPFASPYPATRAELPMAYQEMEDHIAEIERQCRYWAERKKELTEGVMREMVRAGVYNWTGEQVQFIRKKDSIRKTFDKEAFEKDHPGVYARYLKESPVVGSITLKLN